MKLRPFIIAIAALTFAPATAQAFMGECYLSVGSRTYLDGTCDVTLEPGGSFSIGAGDRSRSKYFAFVNIDSDEGSARGSWNGSPPESHAHDQLGTLVRQGGCWINSRAKVCAWRFGTRPNSF